MVYVGVLQGRQRFSRAKQRLSLSFWQWVWLPCWTFVQSGALSRSQAAVKHWCYLLLGSLCVCCIAKQKDSNWCAARESSMEFSMLVLNIGDFKQHVGRIGLLLLWNSWHMKISAMIDRKFSKYPGPVNWNKRVRDERQRALNEFLKAGF